MNSFPFAAEADLHIDRFIDLGRVRYPGHQVVTQADGAHPFACDALQNIDARSATGFDMHSNGLTDVAAHASIRNVDIPHSRRSTVAAIIPAYNSGVYLRQSIESVLAQTYPVDEIIVVDDGSLDNTRDLVLSYGDRVRYYWQENRGVSAARNFGVRQSSCSWVAFLDADDWWEPSKIELQMAALGTNPDAILCYTAYTLVGPGEVKALCTVSSRERIWPDLRYRNLFANSTVMMRRDLFLEIGGFDEANVVCQDWDLWFRAARNRKVTAVEEPVTSIRVVAGSLSRSKTDRILQDLQLMIAKTLVADLKGLSRWAWAKRAWSAELYRCGIVERENQTARALPLVLRSLAAWPSPFFINVRFKSLLIYLIRPNVKVQP